MAHKNGILELILSTLEDISAKLGEAGKDLIAITTVENEAAPEEEEAAPEKKLTGAAAKAAAKKAAASKKKASKGPSLEDVRVAFRELAKSKGRATGMAVLEALGVESATDLEVDAYPQAMEAIKIAAEDAEKEAW